MQKIFDFRPFDSSKSDFCCAEGEVQLPSNLIRRADGSYSPAFGVDIDLVLPSDYTGIALHSVSGEMRLIAVSAGSLYWAQVVAEENNEADGDAYSIGEFELIAPFQGYKAVEMIADKVVIATDQGLTMLVWRADGYDFVKANGAIPVLEFGLQKVGALVCGDVFDADGLDLVGSGITGSGASAVHPTAEMELTQHTALFKEVAKAYIRSVEAQISSKGYFHQPFFVRYALRLSDGSHVLPSPPVLMLPTVLPPCIGVNVASSRVSLDLSNINFFELRYKFSSWSVDAFAQLGSAIDVFVSKPISTFDLDSIESGYLSNYSQQIEGSNAVNHDRSPSRGDTDADALFEGHYSTGADNYIDHYLDASLSDKTVLALRSNPSFNQQVCSTADFYLVASIPLEGRVSEGAAFESLVVDNTDSAYLASLPKLVDNVLSHCALRVSAMAAVRGRMMAALEGMALPAPFPMRCMGAAWCDDTGDEEMAPPVTVTVYTKIGTSVSRISSVSMGWAVDIGGRFPRYVYYPDKHAFMMVVSVGAVNYMLPLAQHPSLEGAYWCGGYAEEYVPDGVDESALPQVDDESRPRLRCCKLLMSESGNPMIFSGSGGFDIADADVKVMALAEATKAPRQGSFGKFNFYAFTSRGLWMLECDSGSVKSGQLISRHPCSAPTAVAWTETAVAWSGRDGVFLVSGSDVTNVSSSLEAMALDLRYLPCYQRLLDVVKMEAVGEEFADLIAEFSLAALPGVGDGVVAAYHPGKDYSLVYDIAHKQWSVFSAGFDGKIKMWDGRYRLLSENAIVNVSECEKAVNTLLVTRPITLSAAFQLSDISRVEILGGFSHSCVGMAVYGSADMHHWQLITTARGSIAETFDRKPYRHFRIAVAAKLSPGDSLFGAKISMRK